MFTSAVLLVGALIFVLGIDLVKEVRQLSTFASGI